MIYYFQEFHSISDLNVLIKHCYRVNKIIVRTSRIRIRDLMLIKVKFFIWSISTNFHVLSFSLKIQRWRWLPSTWCRIPDQSWRIWRKPNRTETVTDSWNPGLIKLINCWFPQFVGICWVSECYNRAGRWILK